MILVDRPLHRDSLQQCLCGVYAVIIIGAMRSTIIRAVPEAPVTRPAEGRVRHDPNGAVGTVFPTPPSILLNSALVALRVGTAALFMLHALVRVLKPGALSQFGLFLEKSGVPQGVAVVWMITVFELGAGLLMAIGYRTRYVAMGFGVILVGGIVLIHRHLGWFVGEHGTGGSEYSVSLLLALLVIAAADRSGADRSGADHSGADRSGADHSGADHSGTDHSGTDHTGLPDTAR